MRYICDKYGEGNSLYPRDPQQRAIVDRMMDYDLGTLYKAIRNFTVSIISTIQGIVSVDWTNGIQHQHLVF